MMQGTLLTGIGVWMRSWVDRRVDACTERMGRCALEAHRGAAAARQPGGARRTPPRTLFCIAALCALLTALSPPAAQAVLLSGGDGTQNTSAPVDDFGFASTGVMSFMTVVYLGNRWVLAADHTPVGPVDFGGTVYPEIPGSKVVVKNANMTDSELALIRLIDDPGVPAATITTTPPQLNAQITLLGNGKNRGASTSWMGVDGFEGGSGRTLRWGTNRIADTSETIFDTDVFYAEFTEPGGSGDTADEAQSADGDSGGPVFRKIGGDWELVGTLLGAGTFGGQPSNTYLYGNVTYVSDLTTYRSSILAIVEQPSCSDGLDDDQDGATDYPADPGCSDANDTSERDPGLQCDDGIDNDGDQKIDHPADPECLSPTSPSEAPPPVPALVPPAAGALAAALLLLGAHAPRGHAPGINR